MKLTKTKVKKALMKTGGVQAEAARLLDCNKSYLNVFVKANELKPYIEECREMVGVVAEGNIVRSISEGNVADSKWWKERTDSAFSRDTTPKETKINEIKILQQIFTDKNDIPAIDV